jgi:hypothetical protein
VSEPIKHSPGPWRESITDHHNSIRDARDVTVAAFMHGGDPGWNDLELMLAAPEMYRILCQICNQDQNWGVVFQGPIVDARTLLKKLEGEQ